MTRVPLEKRIGKEPLFLDGAMGTQLFERGVQPGGCNEKLTLDRPDIVMAVHKAYLDAGSDAVLTNTFGANAISLGRHGLAGQVKPINLAAARIARQAAGPSRYVIGDIGPTGDFLEPLGLLKEADLFRAFAEQAKALDEGGVDGFIIETMTALDEIEVAIKAVKSVSAKSVFASLAFDPVADCPRTMMGISPQSAAKKLSGLGVTAIGFNCGTLDMDGYVSLSRIFKEAIETTDLILLAEPNAGRPQIQDDKTVYNLSPAEFAEAMVRIRDAGASLLGGCCGTTPDHIAAAVHAIR